MNLLNNTENKIAFMQNNIITMFTHVCIGDLWVLVCLAASVPLSSLVPCSFRRHCWWICMNSTVVLLWQRRCADAGWPGTRNFHQEPIRVHRPRTSLSAVRWETEAGQTRHPLHLSLVKQFRVLMSRWRCSESLYNDLCFLDKRERQPFCLVQVVEFVSAVKEQVNKLYTSIAWEFPEDSGVISVMGLSPSEKLLCRSCRRAPKSWSIVYVQTEDWDKVIEWKLVIRIMSFMTSDAAGEQNITVTWVLLRAKLACHHDSHS